nr:hypothetical protein [Pseudomonadota bacterium]
KGIKTEWHRQTPDGFPTYQQALKEGVALELAQTSDNPLIKEAVRNAIARIIGEEPMSVALVSIFREVADRLARAREESAE